MSRRVKVPDSERALGLWTTVRIRRGRLNQLSQECENRGLSVSGLLDEILSERDTAEIESEM